MIQQQLEFKKKSQTQRLLELLSDGEPHRSDEILEKVYGGSHLGIARISARIYDLKQKGYDIVGFKDKHKLDQFNFPEPIELTKTIHDIVNTNDKKPEYFYYKEDHQYYSMLKESMKNKDTMYQWRRVYVRENKSNACPTLTANMGTGGHNVPLLIDDYGFRKLTPEETFLFQGFPEEFKLPKGMARSHLYKQAGNSVPVPVVERIAMNMLNALDS